jgi:uncharacterized membrane protein YkvI
VSRQPSGNAPVPARSLGLATAIMLLAGIGLAATWTGPPAAPFYFWLIVCAGGELLRIPMPLGRASLSMASACNFAALLVLPQGQAMLAAASAALLAEALLRKPALRLLFNAAQTVLAVGLASFVYHRLAAPVPMLEQVFTVRGLTAIVLAAATYALVNGGLVSLVVGLSERMSPLRVWRTNFGSRYELFSNSALVSLGVVIAVLFALAGPLGLVFVVMPLLLAYDSYRRVVRAQMG